MTELSSIKRRHTLPSTSFVDPAIVRFIEKATSHSSSSSIILQDEYEDADEEDQRTTISTISLPQQLDYHNYYNKNHHHHQQHIQKEKYHNLELRLSSLEVTKKRFEQRLQMLEMHQPMKPDQIMHESGDSSTMMVTRHEYTALLNKHELLLSKYALLEEELKQKDLNIQQLTRGEQKEDEESSYKEEDGYLIFDTTNMNGEIIHCKVKIPTPSMSPPATRVGSPHYLPPTPISKKKGLNYNAPEWKYHK